MIDDQMRTGSDQSPQLVPSDLRHSVKSVDSLGDDDQIQFIDGNNQTHPVESSDTVQFLDDNNHKDNNLRVGMGLDLEAIIEVDEDQEYETFKHKQEIILENMTRLVSVRYPPD